MLKPTGPEDARSMAQATTMAVLVQPSASTVGEAVRLALEAAGLRTVVVPTVFDAVVEIERAAGAVRYLAAGVDYFGPQEFRLLPLVRREWPETILIATHSPGFNYKGRLAELVGADVILGSVDDVSRFAADLPKAAVEAAPLPPAPPPAPPAALPPQGRTVSAAAAAVPTPPEPMNPVLAGVLAAVHEEPVPVEESPSAPAPERTPSPPMSAFTSTAAAAPPSVAATVAAAAAKPATAPEPAAKAGKSAPPRPAGKAPADDLEDAEVIGTIELTEEELRLLLGEEEGA